MCLGGEKKEGTARARRIRLSHLGSNHIPQMATETKGGWGTYFKKADWKEGILLGIRIFLIIRKLLAH